MSAKGKARTAPHRSVLDRFIEKVSFASNGCWEWTSSIDGSGYGLFMMGSRADGTRGARRASRVSYELHVGPIGNSCVCHRCDNRRCVNPEHLFLGSRYDNMQDMLTKGRGPNQAGEKNGNARLSLAQATEIFQRYHTGGVTFAQLASEYGVGITTVGDLVSGKTWPRLRAALESEE